MKKLIFSSKYFMILFMFSSLVYVGCHKDDGKEVASVSSSSTQLRTTVNPTVENGTLKFNSLSDSYSFLTEISELVNKDDSDSTSNLVLNPSISFNTNLKTNLNFISLFDGLPKDTDGFTTNPVFPDDAINLMMNENREIIIGDSIYKHNNVSEFYIIHKNDVSNKTILNTLTNNELIPVDKIKDGIKIVSNDSRVIFRSGSISECLCVITLEIDRSSVPPIGKQNYKLTYHCEGLNSNSNWRIEFPTSGSPSITGQAGLGSVSTIFFTGPDPFGVLDIKFNINQNCGKGFKEYCYDFSINTSNSCCARDIDTLNHKIMGSTGTKVIGRVRSGISMWGLWHHSRIESRSVATNNFLRADLQQWLSVKARVHPNNTINPCTVAVQDTDYDVCDNCRWNIETVYINDFIHHKLGDGVFDFKLKRHGNSVFMTIIPEYCL